jgi:predicted Zn-dependent protease
MPTLPLDMGGGTTLQMKPESLEEELGAGKLVVSQMLGAAKLLRNPGLQKYVNLVGRRVADQSGRKDLKWSFGVVDSTAVNAFASPGTKMPEFGTYWNPLALPSKTPPFAAS